METEFEYEYNEKDGSVRVWRPEGTDDGDDDTDSEEGGEEESE